MVDRWVLRYEGDGEPPAADVSLIGHAVRILDATDRMLLVEARSDQVAHLVRTLPQWHAAKERSFTLVT
jgi:hypothetical protein